MLDATMIKLLSERSFSGAARAIIGCAEQKSEESEGKWGTEYVLMFVLLLDCYARSALQAIMGLVEMEGLRDYLLSEARGAKTYGLQFSVPGITMIVSAAADLCDRRSGERIDTIDLLLAILQEGQTYAASKLKEQGVCSDQMEDLRISVVTNCEEEHGDARHFAELLGDRMDPELEDDSPERVGVLDWVTESDDARGAVCADRNGLMILIRRKVQGGFKISVHGEGEHQLKSQLVSLGVVELDVVTE